VSDEKSTYEPDHTGPSRISRSTVLQLKPNGQASNLVGWLTGLVGLLSYLAIGASPESSYIEWGAFYLVVSISSVTIRHFYGRLAGVLSLLPLLAWNCVWASIHALRGRICGDCLMVLAGGFLLISVTHLAFKFLRFGSEK